MRFPLIVALLLSGPLWCRAQASPSARTVHNLETFARLYGYVRYFHPSDEAAAADWDALAQLGSQRAAVARTPAELQATLLTLFRPLAPTLQLLPAGLPAPFTAAAITPPTLAQYQVISWQHQGLGLGAPNSPYHSARTHRPAPTPTTPTPQQFGTLTNKLDATPYRGYEFRYSAAVRNAHPTQGPGALWARVDLAPQGVGFFDNMRERPITRGEWTTYTIHGRLDAQAQVLSYGVMLQGEGQLEVDQLRVEVREGADWKTLFATGFEADSTGRYPSSITPHPGPATRANGYAYLVQEGPAAEGQRYVTITHEGAAAIPVTRPEGPLLFARQTALGEVVQQDIGSGLRCVLPLALYGTPTATYPAADPVAGRALQRALAAQLANGQTGTSRAVRLAAVVIAWNVFQHFYPYFAQTAAHWPAALPEALRAAYPDQSAEAFEQVLQRLIAHLHDGHGSVTNPRVGSPQRRLPLTWEWVEHQLVLTRVLADSLPVHRGDIVTAIDGQSPRAYFQAAEQLLSAATPGLLHYQSANRTTWGPVGQRLRVQVQDAAGTRRTLSVAYSQPLGPLPDEPPAPAPYRLLAPGVWYLNLDRLSLAEINQHLPELAQAKALVCDLRGYPRDNHLLLTHLLSHPDTARHWMRVPQYLYPNQQRVAGYRFSGWQLQPQAPHLAARVFFITDGRAISYAESVLGIVEGYQLATIVGQPSAGTNGNVNFLPLPGGYTVRWTGMEVRHLDGRPHYGVGVQPQVYVEKTLQGVRAGRDEFLAKALELATAP